MKELLKHYSSDIPAGLVVFLVALPLCLGIAVASGADPISGLITGIVGGIVTGMISGSHLAVSGPAASMTVIVLDAIDAMPSFNVFIAAVVLAGVLQLIFGYVKAGLIGAYFPTSVIRGMLTAIGLILIFKQLPHFFGFDKEAFGNMDYDDHQGGNTFSDLFAAAKHTHTGALIIGILSLGIILFWELPFMKKMKFTKLIPGALVAVVVGVIINNTLFTGG